MEVRESASSTVGTNVPGAAWSVRSPRRAETARLIARAATFAGPCCWGARSPSDRSSCWPVRRDGARSCAAAKSRSCSRRSAALMRRCAVVVMPLMCAGHVRDGRTAGHGLRRPLPGAGPPRPGVATPWHAKVLPALASATVSRRQTVATAVAMVEAMGELLYEGMDPDQAADALDEFIAERGAALEHLRSVLAAEGLDPHTTLDHTVESVARVWETITARAARLGVNPRSLEDDPTRPSWPSWARHGMLVDPHPPAATLALVDGFTSCLSRLFTTAVPGAAWIVGEHRIADHPMRDPRCSPPGTTWSSCRRSRSTAPTSPPTAAHPQVVEEMIAQLRDRDGVESVHRCGQAALVVTAPSWDGTRLKLWCGLWPARHLPR